MKRSQLTTYVNTLALGTALLGTTAKAESDEALYTMDNAAAGNHVLAFERGQDGSLSAAGSFGTGGTGSGAGLSSQGSIALTHDGRWLLVCNAGSSEVSALAVSRNGLVLTDKIASGGKLPVSLSLHGEWLYVLNAGGLVGDKDNITAFDFAGGKLTPVPNSTTALSGDNTGPAEVSFTRDGDVLVVTERLTSLLDTFVVGHDGMAGAHKTFQSAGATPFGFDVGRKNRIFVSEAAGSASSYEVSEEGELAVITASALTKQAAPCWLLLSHDGRFAYTANAGAGSISGFDVNHDGALELLTADGRTATTGAGSHPVDMAQSQDGRFLYSLNNGNGTLTGFRVKPDGSLQPVAVVNGIATSAAGLAGR
jgi:6-phosphogluconolactonase (cycloisomerase 2 family)